MCGFGLEQPSPKPSLIVLKASLHQKKRHSLQQFSSLFQQNQEAYSFVMANLEADVPTTLGADTIFLTNLSYYRLFVVGSNPGSVMVSKYDLRLRRAR
jgi:hypothetical protein